MVEKKKRGRPKKTENQSLLKTIKPEKKPRKIKSETSKKVKSTTKHLKRITIKRESIAFPGIFLDTIIWNSYTPFDELINGDEVITACGYHGFICEKHDNHATIIDTKGNGYRTIIKEALFKMSDGRNNPDYIHEMKLRKLSKQRGNVATIEDNNYEEVDDE